MRVSPVILPPGRAALWTKPMPTGSGAITTTGALTLDAKVVTTATGAVSLTATSSAVAEITGAAAVLEVGSLSVKSTLDVDLGVSSTVGLDSLLGASITATNTARVAITAGADVTATSGDALLEALDQSTFTVDGWLALNDVSGDVGAVIEDSSLETDAGSITLSATDQSEASATTGGLSIEIGIIEESKSLSEAVARNRVDRNVDAHALDSTLTANDGNITIAASAERTLRAEAETTLGTRFDQATYEALIERHGLDRPLVIQYFTWLGSALVGDLGVSFRSGRPVTEILVGRLPATLTLGFAALLVALVIALPLGVISAVRSGKAVDYAATSFSQLGISIPDFWMAIMFILLFSLTLGWLPPSGYVPLTQDPVGWAQHAIMPAVTIGVVSGSILTRFVRSAVLEALSQDYTRTARSKGLRERIVVNRHVLKNAMIPVVTVTGLQLAFLLGGVIVVEIIFAWPGIGQLTLIAIRGRDYTVLQGAVLFFAVLFLLINLIVDLLYAWLDPRIKVK